MSKLNANKYTFNFFKNNKIKCCAIIGAMITSLSMCSPISTKKTEHLMAIKYSIENNLDNILVIKDLDNKCYNITESPKTISNDNQYIHYSISFGEADKMNITELLDEKTTKKIKKKEWIN